MASVNAAVAYPSAFAFDVFSVAEGRFALPALLLGEGALEPVAVVWAKVCSMRCGPGAAVGDAVAVAVWLAMGPRVSIVVL